MSSAPFDPQFVVEADLANARLQSIREYLVAGRRWEHVDLVELRELAVRSLQEWNADPDHSAKMQARHEVCCELQPDQV